MKKIINILLIALVLVSVGSCAKEKMLGGKPGTEGDTEIMLRLRTPGGFNASGTRGLTFAQENAINDVYVLVFDNQNKLVDIKQGHDVDASTTDPSTGISGKGSFKFTVTPSKSSIYTYNLVVLVNVGAILGETIGTDDSSTSIGDGYATVAAKIYASITGGMYASGGAIPMWGETGQIVVSATTNDQAIQLMRAVARIDVGVGNAMRTTTTTTDTYEWDGMTTDGLSVIPFELKEVYVIKPSNRYAVIPAAASLSSGNPTLPEGVGKFTFEQSETSFAFSDISGVTAGRGGWSSRSIYVPEADIRMGDEGAQGDDNHTERMAVVVGGDYNGSGETTYYRLDFARNGKLMNAIRNRLYQFNISMVHGAGLPSVKEAYNSMAINMIAEVMDWNESSIEVHADGTNWVRLWVSENSLLFGNAESKEAIVFRNVNSTDRIRFSTNTSLENIAMALDNGGDFPNPDNTMLIENERFRVEIVTEGDQNFFEFTALKAYDPAAADNPSTLTVTVGKIEFRITITQHTGEKTDWTDGGGIPKDL